jgi:hypothetical protein
MPEGIKGKHHKWQKIQKGIYAHFHKAV